MRRTARVTGDRELSARATELLLSPSSKENEGEKKKHKQIGSSPKHPPRIMMHILNSQILRSPKPPRSFLKKMRILGLSPDAYTVNALLQQKNPHLEPAVLLKQLEINSNPPDAYTVSLLTSHLYHHQEEVKNPFDLLKLIRAFVHLGVPVQSQAYEKVLRLCARQGEASLSRRVGEEMVLLGLPVTQEHVFLGFCSIARDKTRRHDSKSQSSGSMLAREVAFWEGRLTISEQPPPKKKELLSARYAALSAANLIPERVLVEFEQLVEEKSPLVQLGGSPSNAMLALLAKRPEFAERALSLYRKLAEEGREGRPDTYTYNAVLNAAATGASFHPTLALELLEDMRDAKAAPDASTLSILTKMVKKKCFSGSTREHAGVGIALLELLQDMVKEEEEQMKEEIENRLTFLRGGRRV